MKQFYRPRNLSQPRHSNARGFTIVELLIVIVVIGILAAITIVAYNGVQQKANNTTTENLVSQYRRALILYATENSDYPSPSSSCLGEGIPSCYGGNVQTDFNTKLRPYMGSGTLPAPTNVCHMMYGSCRNGAAYSRQQINLDGSSHTWSISYMLDGDVKCTAAGQAGGTWTNASSTPNAAGRVEFSSGTALCRVILPNPTAL